MNIINWIKAHAKPAAIGIAAVLLIAGGAGGYALLNRPPDPQATLNQAIVNTAKAHSAALRLTVEYMTKHGFAVTVRVLGAQTPQQGHYQAVLSIDTGLVDMNFTGQLFQAEDGDIYVRLGNNQALAPFLQGATGIDEEAVANLVEEMGDKWVRIGRFDVTENTEILAAWNCALEYSHARLKNEDEPALLTLLQKYPYAKAAQELPGETVLGEPSRRYAVTLDYTHEAPLYEAIGMLGSFKPVSTECKDVNLPGVTGEQPADMPQVFLQESTEVWVGKANNLITKIATKGSAPGYDMTVTLENTYKPITLSAPTDYILFERIRELFAPGSLDESYEYEFDYEHPPEDGHSH